MPRAFAEDGSQDAIDSTSRIAEPTFIIEVAHISEKYGVLIMFLFPEEKGIQMEILRNWRGFCILDLITCSVLRKYVAPMKHDL